VTNIETEIGTDSPMRDVLERFLGAQRALFRRHHIGSSGSCGFSLDSRNRLV
jgi:hypothetical protein